VTEEDDSRYVLFRVKSTDIDLLSSWSGRRDPWTWPRHCLASPSLQSLAKDRSRPLASRTELAASTMSKTTDLFNGG